MLGRRTCLLLAISLALLCAPGAFAGTAVADHALETGVLQQINALRSSHGLARLRLNPALSAAAAGHSLEMAQYGYFSHDDVHGAPFSKRVEARYPSGSYAYWQTGENLLWSSPGIDAAGALKMWWNSPPHRENLLRPAYREIGLSAVHATAAPGAFGGLEVTIVTADFGVRR
jgi:uncharacterized protein YkwD